MAITPQEFNVIHLPTAQKRWFASLASEDVSGAEVLKAAEVGFTHLITHLQIRTDAAMDVTIGSGEDAGEDDVATIHWGPIPLDAAGGIFVWDAPSGMALRCTDDLALVIDSTAAGTIWIEAWGYTAIL